VDPRAGLDVCEKSRPHRDSIPGPSSPWPVAIPTELPGPSIFVVSLYRYKSTNKGVEEVAGFYRCIRPPDDGSDLPKHVGVNSETH
jgi:hypothetical protein